MKSKEVFIIVDENNILTTGIAYTTKETAEMARGCARLVQMTDDPRSYSIQSMKIVDCEPDDLIKTLRALKR